MNIVFRTALASLLITAAAMHSPLTLAHGRWILPSQFVFSGEEPEYVAVDMSISNEVFHPDYSIGGDRPDVKQSGQQTKEKKPDEFQLRVTTPDGRRGGPVPLVDLVRKSSAAVLLDQSGTYRLSVEHQPMYFTWYELPNGEKSRAWGAPSVTRKRLPKSASNIVGTKLVNRVEAFVTRNQPNNAALKTPADGLALALLTHPAELFVGERARFALLMDGEPVAAKTAVKLTRNDTRYRNQRAAIELLTDKDGAFTVEFSESGVYLLEAELEQASSEKGIASETYALFVTLEVQPE